MEILHHKMLIMCDHNIYNVSCKTFNITLSVIASWCNFPLKIYAGQTKLHIWFRHTQGNGAVHHGTSLQRGVWFTNPGLAPGGLECTKSNWVCQCCNTTCDSYNCILCYMFSSNVDGREITTRISHSTCFIQYLPVFI